MLKMLFRLALFLGGCVLLLETALPTVQEHTTVDRHVSTERSAPGLGVGHDTQYVLNFFGSRLHSCDVGYVAYSTAKDGDALLVRYSKIFKTCVQLDRAGETIYEATHWRAFSGIGAAVLILIALGVIRSDDEAA